MSDVNEQANLGETQDPAASSPDETDLAGNPVGGDAGAGDESDEGVEGAGQEGDGAGTGDESGGSVEAPPVVAGPRAIEELRTAGVAEMTDEEVRLVIADLGDPTAESTALHNRIAETQDALTETIKETNREIGKLRDEVNEKFPTWQNRLAKIHRCKAELTARENAAASSKNTRAELSPQQAAMRENAVKNGSIAG